MLEEIRLKIWQVLTGLSVGVVRKMEEGGGGRIKYLAPSAVVKGNRCSEGTQEVNEAGNEADVNCGADIHFVTSISVSMVVRLQLPWLNLGEM